MKISEKELIEDLKKVSKIVDGIPKQKEYIKYGKYSSTTFTNRKKWNLWLEEIFGNTNRNFTWRNGNKISKEELENNLLELYNRLNRIPQKEDLKLGKYGSSGYNRVFGGLGKALIAVGLKNPIPSEKEVIEDIKTVYKKLNYTPSLKDYYQHSKFGTDITSIYKIFDSWTKALIMANVPVIKARNVSKQDVIDALIKYYNENDRSTSCLEYWIIRKSKCFPYSCNTIKSKFNGMPWEKIMQQIDPSYETKDPFIGRHEHMGKDGQIYLSSIECQVADILYDFKMKNKIKNYEYEATVCDDKPWTCDFKIELDGRHLWLEVDGMRNNRKVPYKDGNEKIEFYKDNVDYEIISYLNPNIKGKLERLIERRSNGKVK